MVARVMFSVLTVSGGRVPSNAGGKPAAGPV